MASGAKGERLPPRSPPAWCQAPSCGVVMLRCQKRARYGAGGETHGNYAGMRANPCTNHPILCPGCPPSVSRYVWKYNMTAHWSACHSKKERPDELNALIKVKRNEKDRVKEKYDEWVRLERKRKTAKIGGKSKKAKGGL